MNKRIKNLWIIKMSDTSNTNTTDTVVIERALAVNDFHELQGDLKEIYSLVSTQVTNIVAVGKLKPEQLRPLVLNVIEVVQNYTQAKYDHIDGAQKKSMAINILQHVILDLKNKGQLTVDEYTMISMGLDFFGSALIDFGKMAYNKLVETVDDIAEHGYKGCVGRNCRPRRVN